MKSFASTFLLLLLFTCAIAQEDEDRLPDGRENYQMKTLLGNNKKISHGGYLGISVLGTQINDEDGLLVGGTAAWLINHRLGIGVSGYGLTNTIGINNNIVADEVLEFGMGYGGLHLEPIFFPESPIHITTPVLLGAGGAGYWDSGVQLYNPDTQSWSSISDGGDAFWVVEPGIDIEANIVRFMRIAVGAKYRYVGGLDLNGLNNDDLTGFSAGLSLKLGWF